MPKNDKEVGAIFMEDEAPSSVSKSLKSAAQRAAELRQKRDGHKTRTLGGFDRTLDVDGEIPGYHMYICREMGNRLNEALEYGYEFVLRDEVHVNGNIASNNTDLGDKIRFVMDRPKPGQDTVYGYLLKIPLEIWEESNTLREQKNLAIDKELLRGTLKDPSGPNDDLETMPQHSSVRIDLGTNKTKFIIGERNNGS